MPDLALGGEGGWGKTSRGTSSEIVWIPAWGFIYANCESDFHPHVQKVGTYTCTYSPHGVKLQAREAVGLNFPGFDSFPFFSALLPNRALSPFLGKGSPFNSTNNPFFPWNSTGHLSQPSFFSRIDGCFNPGFQDGFLKRFGSRRFRPVGRLPFAHCSGLPSLRLAFCGDASHRYCPRQVQMNKPESKPTKVSKG